MLHSRGMNNRINKIHERTLRIFYDDNLSTFEELLLRDGSMTIHEKNIQFLAIELFKVINGLSPEIMKEVFPVKETNNYWSRFSFNTRNVRTVTHGTETLSYLGPKLWSIVPKEITNSESLNEFKRKIKKWKPDKCPCRICKKFVSGLGFVNVAI